MERRWDEFSKSLAVPLSRRESLRRLGAVFVGAVFGALGLGSARGAHEQDLCCGDEDCRYWEACCSGVCIEIWFDSYNCGACGITCAPWEQCNFGNCESPPGSATVAKPRGRSGLS